jgi:hypothetical protein
MGLIMPGGPDWGACTNNFPATVSSNWGGTFIACGMENTKGSWYSLLPALEFDVEYIKIHIMGTYTYHSAHNVLLDVGIDKLGGTSYEVLVPNLLAGWMPDFNYSKNRERTYYFPLHIPAGSTVAARAQSNKTASYNGPEVTIEVYGNNRNPASWRCGQRVSTLGIDTSNGIGTMVTPHATANEWGSWANIGAPITSKTIAMQCAIQGVNVDEPASHRLYMDFGVSGDSIGAKILAVVSSSSQMCTRNDGFLFRSFPIGTQMQARHMSSLNNGDAIDAAIYLVH